MIEGIKKQTYIVILISAILPLLVFSLIIFGQFRSAIYSASYENLESLRNEWLFHYRFEYGRLFQRLDNVTISTSIDISSSFETQAARNPNYSTITRLIDEEAGVTEVAFFDESYIPRLRINQSGIESISNYTSQIRLELQEIVFPAARVTKDIQLADGTSALYVFYKFTDERDEIVYAVWKTNYHWLLPPRPEPSEYIRRVYNNKYQLIASNENSRIWSSVINDQTERMLDGYSETKLHGGILHSYGFVDLGQTAIFGDLTLNMNVHKPLFRTFYTAAIFFTLFTFLMGVILAWSFSGKLIRFGESLLIKNHYTGEMRFFSRLTDNLSRIREDADTLTSMQTRLGYLLNDLDTIQAQTPSPAEESPENTES